MSLPFWFGGSSEAGPSDDGAGSGAGRFTRARESIKRHEPEGADDRAIVARIGQGNERVFEQLVRDFAPILARFAYDYVRSSEIAEEIVNDVFVWVWEHRAHWEVRGSLRAYLFSAVRHRVLNARRDAAYRDRWAQQHLDDPAAAGLGHGISDPVRDVEAWELGVLLRRAVDRLPEGRRIAVLLRWVHGMSYAEIAQVAGTSVVGVKQQLNRALRELRATLPQFLR